jgi:ATP adenylyltransferase
MFTPWRMSYLRTMGKTEGCLFCGAAGSGANDRESLVLHRGPTCFVIINLYPYSSGHLMVVPRRHLGRLAEASVQERREIMETVARCEAILEAEYRPHGMNVGLNLGRAAGAGVVGHLHVHLVPRWDGDSNFASVIGGTRIIPETPPQTWERLRPLFQDDAAPPGAAP